MSKKLIDISDLKKVKTPDKLTYVRTEVTKHKSGGTSYKLIYE